MQKFIVHCSLFIVFLLSTIYYLPSTTHAQPSPSPSCGVKTDLGCLPTDPLGFSTRLYEIGLGFIGSVALIFIIYGGYLVLTSRGDQVQLGKGKSYIVSAIIGIVMAVSGYAIYQIITVDVIKLPGFGK